MKNNSISPKKKESKPATAADPDKTRLEWCLTQRLMLDSNHTNDADEEEELDTDVIEFVAEQLYQEARHRERSKHAKPSFDLIQETCNLGLASSSSQASSLLSETLNDWRSECERRNEVGRVVEEEEGDDDDGDEEEEGEEQEFLRPGECVICYRIKPLTFHHLIPRKTHKKVVRLGLASKQECHSRGIYCCRMCHNALHGSIEHWDMATEYNTLDKLMTHKALIRYQVWAAKQK
ncbi:hypothetical protein HDU77_001233 [Chytriomyces hyalinus]|nr:hypothetical protein HDU77_001233 [Chytriomyces hyalinus]